MAVALSQYKIQSAKNALSGAHPGILVRGGVKVAGSSDRQKLLFKFICFIDIINLDIY